ncbi:Fumarate reductase flavoprotein subunit, partial [gut metagenome]
GYSVKGDNLQDLAKKINVPADTLEATFKAYHEAYKLGKDTAFGRPEMVIPLDKAPFYAALITPGIHHTMGGVTINTKAEVQSKAGKSIPGLFAAGEVTGGVHGANRIGGNAVADIVTFGRIAGTNASAYAKAH